MHSPPFPSATTKFTPLLIVSNQPYLLKMKSGLLQGRLGHLHCMQRNWLAPDKKPQLPNERQLHHCLHVSDGWQCWQTGGINWQGDQGETSLHFTPPFALVLIDWRCRQMIETVGLVVHMFCYSEWMQSICLYQFPEYIAQHTLHNCRA